MARRDYLPETAIDVVADDANQRQRAIAAAELAFSMGRKSPCLRGVSREWHGFCLGLFKSMQEGCQMNEFTAILDSETFGSSLIIRAKPLPSAYREWYCEASNCGEVIELVILAGWSLADALAALDAHSISLSLKATGWEFGTPWIPQEEDRWGGYSAPLQPRAKPLTIGGVAID